MPRTTPHIFRAACLLVVLLSFACQSTLSDDLGAEAEPGPIVTDDDMMGVPDDGTAGASGDDDDDDDDIGGGDTRDDETMDDGGAFVPSDGGTPDGGPALVGTVPERGANDVDVDTNLRLTFDQRIVAGPGVLQLVEAESEAVVEQTPFDDPRVVVEGRTAVVDLDATLEHATGYYVLIGAGAVTGTDGVAFEGLTDPTAFQFSTRALAAPVLLETTPQTGSTSVSVATDVVLTFDQDVTAGSEGNLVVYEADTSTAVQVVPLSDGALVSISGALVRVDLPTDLALDTIYFLTLDAGAIRGASGGDFPGFDDAATLRFITEAVRGLDLDSTVPEAGATGVSTDVVFSMHFTEDVQPGSGFVTLHTAGDDGVVASADVTSEAVEIGGSTALVDFGTALSGNRTYYVTVDAGAFVSSAGGAFAGVAASEWSFTTESTFATTPEHGSTAVDPATDLTIAFTEAIALGSGNVVVSVEGESLETIPIDDPRVSFAEDTLTVDLDALLAGDTEYDVVVEPGALEWAGGESFDEFAEAGSWSFTTAPVSYPGDVASALVIWLDASHAESIHVDTGIRYWADRSPEHNDVFRAEAEERPILVESGLGGEPVVRFDGIDDSLSAANGLPLTGFEGFLVWQSSVAPATEKRSILINGKNFEVNHGHGGTSARNALAACFGASCDDDQGWQNVRFSPNPVADTGYLWDFGFDTTTTSTHARVQGSAPVTNTVPSEAPTEATTPFSVGGAPIECSNHDGCYFPGDVAEIVIYARTLSRAERLAVTGALRDKWSISPPACDEDEQLGPNGSCYFVSTEPLPADDARTSCQDRGPGWDLASPRAEEDHSFVETLLTDDAWVGGSDDAIEGTWRWLNDTSEFWMGDATGSAAPDAFTAWSADEPSAGSGENCLFVAPGVGWGDLACGDALGFVCEGPGT